MMVKNAGLKNFGGGVSTFVEVGPELRLIAGATSCALDSGLCIQLNLTTIGLCLFCDSYMTFI